MATFTTNYNLKKPDGTDFYNIEDFNSNTDIIDEQLKTLSDSIEKNGFKNMGINGVNIDDVFNYNYVVGLTDDKYGTRPEQSWIIVQNFCATNFIVQTAMKVQNGGTANDNKMWIRNRYSSGSWSGWSQIFSEGAPPTAEQVGALPITGGTLTGHQVSLYSGKGRWRTDGGAIFLECFNTPGDATNYNSLVINSTAQPNPLMVKTSKNGVLTNYKVFGEFNRPTGSYAGNGSATKREIAIGGTGAVLNIRSGYSLVFVWSYGAVIFTNSTVQTLAATEVKFQNGVFTLSTTNSILNSNGATMQYSVL